jgi:hypothetical protein
MVCFSRCLLILAVAFSIADAGAAPRVAVWNPETGTTSSRFKIDRDWLNRVAVWLTGGGVQVSRLSAEQIEDTEQFSAQKFDALFLPGDTFPRRDTNAMQRFAADGGILVSLGAGPVPFLTAIENPTGITWTPSPVAPDKAWETSDIYGKVLGLVYDDVPARRDDGMRHEATPLFKKHLTAPEAPLITRPLPSRWLVPRLGAELYPLIRSRRADGRDTVPQLFIVRNQADGHLLTGIVVVYDLFTRQENKETWPLARQTVTALARIAADLKSGALRLAPEDKIVLHDDEPGQRPVKR